MAVPETLAGIEILRRLISGGREGSAAGRRGRLPGEGEEFYGHRPYYQGDDLRRVDWHAYERTGHAFVKERERGIEGRIAVVVDGSASMCFGEPTRYTTARRAALMLAGSVAHEVEVNLAVAGADENSYRGKRIEEMSAFLEGARADKSGSRGTGIVRRFSRLMFSRGLVVFLGDFYPETEDVVQGTKLALGRSPSAVGVGVRLLTDEDMNAGGNGVIEFFGVEGGRGRAAAWGPRQEETYKKEWARVSEGLVREMASVGIKMLDAVPRTSALDVAIKVLSAGGYV